MDGIFELLDYLKQQLQTELNIVSLTYDHLALNSLEGKDTTLLFNRINRYWTLNEQSTLDTTDTKELTLFLDALNFAILERHEPTIYQQRYIAPLNLLKVALSSSKEQIESATKQGNVITFTLCTNNETCIATLTFDPLSCNWRLHTFAPINNIVLRRIIAKILLFTDKTNKQNPYAPF